MYVKRGRNFATEIAESTGKTAFEINTKVSPAKKEGKRKKNKRTKEEKKKRGRITQRRI